MIDRRDCHQHVFSVSIYSPLKCPCLLSDEGVQTKLVRTNLRSSLHSGGGQSVYEVIERQQQLSQAEFRPSGLRACILDQRIPSK
eukprot:472492-Hanusia_phi.AAC.12